MATLIRALVTPFLVSTRQNRTSRRNARRRTRRTLPLAWAMLAVILLLLGRPSTLQALGRFRTGDFDGRSLAIPSPLNSTSPSADPTSDPLGGPFTNALGSPIPPGSQYTLNALGNPPTIGDPMFWGTPGGGGNGQGPCLTPGPPPASNGAQAATPKYGVGHDLFSLKPVLYKYGAAYETVTDLTVPAAGINWSLTRSYINGAAATGGATTQGERWFNNVTDKWVNFATSTKADVFLDAATKRTFTLTGGVWVAPGDGYSTFTYDSAHTQYVFADQTNNIRWAFFDGNATSRSIGGLKEESTLQLYAQGKSGFQYTLNSSGLPSQITTPTGQNYTIVFTYGANSYLSTVQLKDSSGNLLQQVDYTYQQDVTSPSTDIGTTGDLVQVKVSKHATTDTSGAVSIVRYTQYRYSGTTHNLKAVYENDAVQRMLASTGLSTPTAALSQADTYGSPAIQTFASRSFTYYTSDAATTSINTPFSAGENLQSRYGGSNLVETNYVKTETIGGCGGCGAAQSVTKNYFYMSLGNTATDQNQVVVLVVEDTQDSAGTAVYRNVLGLDGSGRVLRKAFIQNPTGSPTYWCESWTYATSTGTSALPFRLAEHRHPSAHTGVTTSTALQNFLNPYNGTSWSNDTGTVNSSSGLIETYTYNTTGLVTDAFVKNGESGTAYYVGARDYGDSVNPMLVTASYDYPSQTTTRSSGKQTSYSYTFYDSSTHQQLKTVTTTLPTISTGQNGSGVATTKSDYYDNLGRLCWTQDGEGYISYRAYNPVFGTLAYEAVDVDPSSVSSDISSGSSGNWDAWTADGASSNKPTRGTLPTTLALATKTYFDALGRPIHLSDRGAADHYVAYANLQTVTFPYWNSGTSQSLLPIRVTNLNSGAQVTDQLGVRATYTAISTSSGAPTGFSTAPSQSDYVTWTHYTYDTNTGWLNYTDRYCNIPSSGSGTLSSDYYRTVAQYDTLGRKQYDIQVIRGSASSNRVEQVTQYVYDVRDRVIQINKGVSGDSAANSQDMGSSYASYPTLYAISQTVYDSGGVGDDNVTKTRTFFGTGATNYTGTNVYLTYRGHLRGLEPFYVSGSTETAMGPYTVTDVDWNGRTTTAAQYSADPTWSSVLTGDGYSAYASSTNTNRLTQNATLYDDLGRIYQTQQYNISPSTGSGSNYLARNSFYDRNGRIVASAPAYAAGTETAFDGAGRQYETRTVTVLQSTPYSSGAYQYNAPTPNPTQSSLSGGDAGVLELVHRTLDANGNVLETDTFEDNHDDVTGSNPGINLTNNNDYVRRTVFNWYDPANRLTITADYGCGDTASGVGQWKYATIPTRPSSAPTASSSTVLVTLYAYYSDSGLLQTVIEPAGIVTKTFYDNLGRNTYVAENWNDFSPPSTGTGDSTDHSKDRVTKYVYDGPARVQQLVAMDPNGNGTLTNNQITTYLYENPVDARRRTNEICPDSSDTTSSGTNQIKLQYNVDGSLSQRTDQRGVVIAYSYTNNRLPSLQSVTTLPTSVDGTVQSIARTYDNLNRVQNITNYASTSGTGTIVNDVQYAYYNGTTKVVTAYQSHSGAVNTSTSLNVQYTYDTTTTSSIYSNQLRLQTEVHPNSRAIYYDYGSSGGSTAAYSALSNVREIWDGSPSGTGLVVYDYNGGRRLAMATYPQPSFKLDRFEGTSGTYAALDRFGRIVDQYWKGFGSTSDIDRTHYAYDYGGRRTFRQIDPTIYPADNRDQAYTYDGLNRLLTSQIGTLSGSTISGTPASEEDWTLDSLGNWPTYVQKSSGTVNLNQSRTASAANEISAISATVGTTWATPAYDMAGNMTTIPQPSSLMSTYTATYDAWNRLISLANGTTTVATYAYDGLNRRIVKGVYISGALDHNEHAYFNERWQVLELRKEVSGTVNSNPIEQYVWHPFYVDAPVLRDYDTSLSGSPTRYYYTFDANCNVTALTTAAASPVERYYYSPYGSITFLDGTFSALSTQQSQVGNSISFTGRQVDGDTGLMAYRFRYYHAQAGIFLSRDPALAQRDLNLYQYVGARPTDLLDPFGLKKLKVSIGYINEDWDWKSRIAADWNALDADIDIDIYTYLPPGKVRNQYDDAIEQIYNMKPGDCIDSAVISGHGKPGAIGTGEITTITLGDPKSGAYQLLKALGAKMCNDATGVDVRSCNVAAGGHWNLLSDMSHLVGAPVSGIDDMYYVIPFGRQWTAKPDVCGAQVTKDYGRKFPTTLGGKAGSWWDNTFGLLPYIMF